MNDSADLQNAVLAFLGEPRTHGGRQVRRIDTHAGIVFLAGDRALKIKRAVRFPFLDYSTLEKRHRACLAEIEVNRPFAPELYRGVLPITRAPDGRFAIAGEGEPVEWAVEMRRFDETQTLDHVADGGRFDAALADALARAVAAMHAQAPAADFQAWLGKVGEILDQNDAAFREDRDLFPAEGAQALAAAARAAFHRLRGLLLERGRAGLVRRGHGDLHLGNIALIDGKPVPFDAIEFDPLIAAGDVFYDLAFLLMDLVERRLKTEANIVLNRYLLASGRAEDLPGLAALPFFMSLRASIRAKVLAAQLQHVEGRERAKRADMAKVYFALAQRLLAPAQPALVAVGGLSGTGKSTLARLLAPELSPEPGAVVVRSDIERKLLFGVAETDKLPADGYRPEVTAKVYERIGDKAGRILGAGFSAVADAVFGKADERAAIEGVAAERGVPFRGLFLVADLDVRLKRIGGRVADASDADAAVARQQEEWKPQDVGWAEVDASGSLAETLAKARAAIAPDKAISRPSAGPRRKAAP